MPTSTSTSTSTPTSYDLDISTTIGWWGFTKHDASRALAAAPKGEVHVRLSSLGGSLEDGLDIRRRLADHGRVVVHIVGMTASAATVLAMGAQRIVMSRGAALLIHNCSLFVSSWGSKNKEEVDEEMDRLRAVHGTLATLDAVMAGIYAARTGRPETEMAALMSENRWLTAAEALALGLVDEVADDLVPSPAAADPEPSPLEAVAALGLPPLLPEPQAAAPEDAAPLPAAPEADTPSLLRSLLAAVRELGAKAAAAFAPAAPAAEPQATDPAPLTEPQPTNPSTPMNTSSAPSALLLALGLEALPAADAAGAVPLTEAQISALDERLAAAAALTAERDALAAEKTELAAQLAAAADERTTLQERIAELEASDGSDTPAAVAPEGTDEMSVSDLARLL